MAPAGTAGRPGGHIASTVAVMVSQRASGQVFYQFDPLFHDNAIFSPHPTSSSHGTAKLVTPLQLQASATGAGAPSLRLDETDRTILSLSGAEPGSLAVLVTSQDGGGSGTVAIHESWVDASGELFVELAPGLRAGGLTVRFVVLGERSGLLRTNAVRLAMTP